MTLVCPATTPAALRGEREDIAPPALLPTNSSPFILFCSIALKMLLGVSGGRVVAPVFKPALAEPLAAVEGGTELPPLVG